MYLTVPDGIAKMKKGSGEYPLGCKLLPKIKKNRYRRGLYQ